jgi:hypothetical protein
MVRRYRTRAALIVLATSLATASAACGTAAPSPSNPSSSPSAGGAGESASVKSSTTMTPPPTSATTHTITESTTLAVCGIEVRIKVIPPSAQTNSQEQIMLVAAPVGAPPTGDEPIPGTIAPARDGTTVTLLGQRFAILSVQVGARRVTLQAIC